MNNIFVYCEIEDGKVADVSLELLTKGRVLADTLRCDLGSWRWDTTSPELKRTGRIRRRTGCTLPTANARPVPPPHAAVVCGFSRKSNRRSRQPGATPVGRDLGLRVSSTLAAV